AQYGKLIFGVDAAARVYFGKPATTLNLSEAVWLAMQAKNPNLPPSPDDFDRILNEMQASNWISQQDREEARMPDPTSSLAADAYTSIAPGFTDYTLSRLSNRYNLERILRGGLKITTSLNDILQLQVTCATYTQLNRSGTRVENSILPEDHDCQAERLLPTLSGPAGSPPGQLAANVIILDPTNGQILAYVDDPNSNLDPAGLPGHPPGSLLTPFIYLTSFTRGFTPASLLWDIPSEEVMAEIDNLDRQEHGPMRLRIAMANDYLVPAAQIMNRIGFDNIQRTMQQFGLLPFYNDEGSLPDNLDQSILIEGGELTLLDAVQALGILANQGVASGIPAANVESADDPFGTVEPVVVLDIRDTDNHQWAQVPTNRNQPILSTQLAYLVTNILSDEGARWPTLGHPNALEIGRPAAVKPGTTIAGQDVWTVGYTPQMVVGVWVGRVNPENEPPLSEQLSAALWHALMQFAHRDLPTQNWIKPSGITSLDVCDPSGLLPSPDCPTVVSEIFLAGTEPIQVDNLYRAVQINRETGLLATIYTPSDLVEERVYLQVPPDAISWAQQTEISIPPNMYDLVKSSSQDDPNAIISSPSMFSIVGNQVSIIGSAAGEDFSRYRIQIGRGLNPTAWLQIGDDITKPVQEAELFEWDTQGLNGLYTLQLLVERNEQQVDTSTIQVTIDNQAPEVAILYPQLNQVIELSDITIQADIEDNLRVARVRVLIDDQVLSQLDQPPYSTVWKTQPGEHTLTIEAMDEAGNLSTANLRFTVR
ncbi:MAG TPA: Ig-like domain-containing protein, partial [Anaerolineales bacterium]|nr:Ig-like domain-containing protein [Anaerolineales bacterium]